MATTINNNKKIFNDIKNSDMYKLIRTTSGVFNTLCVSHKVTVRMQQFGIPTFLTVNTMEVDKAIMKLLEECRVPNLEYRPSASSTNEVSFGSPSGTVTFSMIFMVNNKPIPVAFNNQTIQLNYMFRELTDFVMLDTTTISNQPNYFANRFKEYLINGVHTNDDNMRLTISNEKATTSGVPTGKIKLIEKFFSPEWGNTPYYGVRETKQAGLYQLARIVSHDTVMILTLR